MGKSKKAQEVVELHHYQGTKAEQLKQLWEKEWYGCTRCQLATWRTNAKGEQLQDIVFGDGEAEAPVMIIGEAPGEEEDSTGIPFVGPSGQLLNQILAINSDDPGIQELYHWFNHVRHTRENCDHFAEKMLEWRRKEFFITNIVACRPPDNRQPTNPEVAACWPRLLNTIYTVDPWLIITMGRPAIQALVHKQVEVTKLRGSIFDVEFPGRKTPYKVPVMACLHPSYLLRQADWNSRSGTYMKTVRDIRNALMFVDALKHQYFGTPIPQRPELPL